LNNLGNEIEANDPDDKNKQGEGGGSVETPFFGQKINRVGCHQGRNNFDQYLPFGGKIVYFGQTAGECEDKNDSFGEVDGKSGENEVF